MNKITVTLWNFFQQEESYSWINPGTLQKFPGSANLWNFANGLLVPVLRIHLWCMYVLHCLLERKIQYLLQGVYKSDANKTSRIFPGSPGVSFPAICFHKMATQISSFILSDNIQRTISLAYFKLRRLPYHFNWGWHSWASSHSLRSCHCTDSV